jgi:dTDP-4-dehydrorhamnose reductase
MRVLVTGSNGDIGKAISKRLLTKGWHVHMIDQKEEATLAGISYSQCDIMNFEALKTQMQGCDAVIHLAAIRAPLMAPNQDVFRINVAGTFNVYEAAAQLGIKRVVQASSINAIGCAWQVDEIYPQYFPLDENHPRFTNDSYSLSKQMVEDIAEYFYHRDGISGTSLRFPWVYNRKRHISQTYLERLEHSRNFTRELVEQDVATQRARLEPLHQEVIAYRKTRPFEFLQAQKHLPFQQQHSNPLWYIYLFERFNFWVALDDRDAAQALEKSITASYEGSHPLFINYPRNTLGLDSNALVKTFYPQIKNVTLNADEALVSTNKANSLLDFKAEYPLHDF